jgi:cobalt-zinc-cadmium efflux system outer membrane protein
MSDRIWRSIIAVVLTAAPLHAQTSGGQPSALAARYYDAERGLSLEQAIAQALEREPALRASRYDIEAARAMRLQAERRPNPSTTFERRDEPGGTDSLTSISFEWPLDLSRKDGRVAVADREIQATEFGARDRERMLAADVRMQYGQVLSAIRDLSIGDELLSALRRQRDLVGGRVGEGASPPLERDLVEVELRRLEAEQLLRAGRADSALIDLKRLLGLEPGSPLTVRDTLEGLVRRELATPAAGAAPLGANAAPDATVNERPDVREADARVQAAAARIDRAHRDGGFDASVFGSYMRMDAGFPQMGVGPAGNLERVRAQFNYISFGGTVSLPMRNRNQGEVAAAEADRLGAEARRDAVLLTARTELEVARARDAAAGRAVAVSTSHAQQLARRNITVVAQTYELGRATVFDVLAEQRRYLELEQAYTGALREAFDARAALKKALGETR